MQSPPRALQKRDSYIMTLCLVSATDPYGVTVSCTPALASCLDSALAKNASANPLKSAVTKSLDLKSPEINTCRKCGGSPLLRFHYLVCFLRFRSLSFASCLSVFISVDLWVQLLPFASHLLPEVFYVTQAQTETR